MTTEPTSVLSRSILALVAGGGALVAVLFPSFYSDVQKFCVPNLLSPRLYVRWESARQERESRSENQDV